jgi:hypothetical protein
MEPEVVMNLWVFTQLIGPEALKVLFPDIDKGWPVPLSNLGHINMNVIYELGVRPYVMSGTDDEMTRLLKELAMSDFHFARRFPLPDRYYVKVTADGGWLSASSGDAEPVGGRVRRGVALVRPDISGMHQVEYFKEALDAVERNLTPRRLGIDGAETRTPTVNRRNLLSVITTVNVDDNGNQVAVVDDPRRNASPSAVVNLWMLHDEKAQAVYALSGRGYMLHGSDNDKTKVLNQLAPNDFSMANAIRMPALAVSADGTYRRDLFDEVYRAIDQEISTAVSIDGKPCNRVTINAHHSLSVATRITEAANNTAHAVQVFLVKGSPEGSALAAQPAPNRSASAPVPQAAREGDWEARQDEIEVRMIQRGLSVEIQAAVAAVRLRTEQGKDASGNVQIVMDAKSQQRHDAVLARARAEGNARLFNRTENQADLALMRTQGVSQEQQDEIEARMIQRGMTLVVQAAVANIRLQAEQVKDADGNTQIVMDAKSQQRHDAVLARAEQIDQRNDQLEQGMKARGWTVEDQAEMADIRRQTEQLKDANGNAKIVMDAKSQQRHDAAVARARAEGNANALNHIENQADLALISAQGVSQTQQDEIEARMIQRRMTAGMEAAVADTRLRTERVKDGNGNVKVVMDARSQQRHAAVLARARREGNAKLPNHIESQADLALIRGWQEMSREQQV